MVTKTGPSPDVSRSSEFHCSTCTTVLLQTDMLKKEEKRLSDTVEKLEDHHQYVVHGKKGHPPTPRGIPPWGMLGPGGRRGVQHPPGHLLPPPAVSAGGGGGRATHMLLEKNWLRVFLVGLLVIFLTSGGPYILSASSPGLTLVQRVPKFQQAAGGGWGGS